MKRAFYYTLLFTGLISFFTSYSFGQFELTGQYKARAEFANGYQRPLMNNQDPGFFIAQRARLGGIYTHERFQFNVTVQDVRTWGNTSHLAIDDNGLLSVYEANVSLFLNKKWAIKVGRQPISYDNQRIFGGLDWAMQGRRHDAALIQFRDSSWSLDVGAAYNQDRPSNHQIFYTVNNYKTFQYVWANKKWTNFEASLLALNNGIDQFYTEDSIQKSRTNFSQTIGTQLSYKRSKFDITAYGYYQMGFAANHQTLSAYNASLAGTYKPNKKWRFTLGGELLSGTSQEATVNDKNRSFTPLFGTNHGFNGFMDYFYVGNHGNNVGLIDGYLKAKYTKGKYTFALANHLFFTESDVRIPGIPLMPGFVAMDPFLGYEIDFTFKYQFVDEVSIQAGYSHMFGTSTMREVKMVDDDDTSGWAYVMLTVKPFKNFKPFEKK
ncbi:hypothetical protein CW751_01460 [Brumimicrobium salinarum]|uniref:Alginate export domain-containing protein n=1 Tax=Brumimicrobium salinarum TaxID=2058658 RepID=A0A2I0R622_9FLAO|nr:alginate export family protein [Brumimicrobium salinarum]PKR82032.1 hypothetical protein CW751_01460 [Brumimicrobium salinarum]